MKKPAKMELQLLFLCLGAIQQMLLMQKNTTYLLNWHASVQYRELWLLHLIVCR